MLLAFSFEIKTREDKNARKLTSAISIHHFQVGYKLEDMTEKLVNNSNDANCRTKESVDRIAVTLCKMETRINQLAGKMELQDETMRQTCATKG